MLAKIPIGFNFEVFFLIGQCILSFWACLLPIFCVSNCCFLAYLTLGCIPLRLLLWNCDHFTLGFLKALAFSWVAHSFRPLRCVWNDPFICLRLLLINYFFIFLIGMWRLLPKLSSLVCLVSFHHFGIDHSSSWSVRKLSSFLQRNIFFVLSLWLVYKWNFSLYLMNDFIWKGLKTSIVLSFAFSCLSSIRKTKISHSFIREWEKSFALVNYWHLEVENQRMYFSFS